MKHAYDINELDEVGPLCRSKIYEKIRDGSLIARRLDKKLVILADDWLGFLKALPRAELGENPIKKHQDRRPPSAPAAKPAPAPKPKGGPAGATV